MGPFQSIMQFHPKRFSQTLKSCDFFPFLPRQICRAPKEPVRECASPPPRDALPQASPLSKNHNLSKPPRSRHFLSYSKITFGRCLTDPFSSIEKPSFKHRKDPFQASKGPLSSIDRPLPLPRQIRRALYWGFSRLVPSFAVPTAPGFATNKSFARAYIVAVKNVPMPKNERTFASAGTSNVCPRQIFAPLTSAAPSKHITTTNACV